LKKTNELSTQSRENSFMKQFAISSELFIGKCMMCNKIKHKPVLILFQICETYQLKLKYFKQNRFLKS